MLIIKPNCECCDKDLPFDAQDARICSFECTFCAQCVEEHFDGICPNCGGNFVARPIRPQNKIKQYPPSNARIINAHKECLET